jgi:hypothetical protein
MSSSTTLEFVDGGCMCVYYMFKWLVSKAVLDCIPVHFRQAVLALYFIKA